MATIIQNIFNIKSNSIKKSESFKSIFKRRQIFIMDQAKFLMGKDMNIIQKRSSQTSFKIILACKQIPPFSQSIIHWTVDFQSQVSYAKAFFQMNEQYTTTKTKRLIVFLFKYFLNLNTQLDQHYVALIDSENGLLELKLKPFGSSQFHNFLDYFFHFLENAQNKISEAYYRIANLINEIPSNFFQFVNQKYKEKFSTKQISIEEQLTKFTNTYFLNCSSPFPVNANNDVINEKSTEKRKKLSKKMGKLEKIFTITNQKEQQEQINQSKYVQLSDNFLNLPQVKVKNNERVFAFNKIEIKNNDFQFRDLGLENKKNKILVAKLKFRYADQNSGQNFFTYLTFEKNIGIKIPKTNNPSSNLKIQHENEIVKLLKYDKTLFLPKYYQCINNNFKFKHSILMDFLHPVRPLSNYIRSTGKQFSFSTQLYIMINVMEALRFIGNHNIVHMDLSMKNILVYNNLMTKLIDFGESYHKDVPTSQKIQHGFTLPYTCPERFSHHQYSPKSDMYSFGVMLFKMIFQQSPFALMDDKLLMKHLERGTYEGKIRMIPESLTYTGHEQLMMLILKYLLLCLSRNGEDRPDPSWSIIILKQIYFVFQN